MNCNKLSLGTAQFGLKYGINNKFGQVQPADVFELLNIAKNNGIDFLDSAYAYGTSESVIGKCLFTNPESYKIISK